MTLLGVTLMRRVPDTICLLVPFALMLCPVATMAASHYFDNATQFLAAAGPLSFDSVEDLVIDDGPVASLSRPGYTLTSDISGPGLGGDYGIYAFHFPAGFGAFATDGTTYLVHQSDTGATLSFDFAVPVTAIGFSITDWESPTGANAELIARNELGDEHLIASGPFPNGNEIFFGMVSDTPFTHLDLFNTSPREAYGIDGIYFSATAVPIPATGFLMLSALLTVFRIRRSAT